MWISDLLGDAFTRINEVSCRAVEGLDTDGLTWQLEPGANPIGWLVWHHARTQDLHVTEFGDQAQIWAEDGWATQFGLPHGTMETGFRHTPDQVRAVRPESADALVRYLRAVTDRTLAFLTTIDPDDLDRVVDTSFDPHVTMGVRLISVVNDGMQHTGQAIYLRGVYDRTVLRT